MDNHDRGVSEVLGYVFVFSLVVTTVAVVSVGGLGQLQDARNAEQLNNAERAFDLLATNVDDVAKRGAPSRSTEMRLDDASVSVAGPVEFTFRGIDNSDPSNNFTHNSEIWPVRYRSDNSPTEIMYVNGAVLRSQEEGSVVLREPAILAENDKIILPVIQTRSRSAQSRAGGTVRIRAIHSRTALLVSDTQATYDTVFVNVTSPRAELWKQTFDSTDEFTCTMDTTGPTDRVWCEASNPQRVHIPIVQVDMSLSG